jgi:magnesium transporter
LLISPFLTSQKNQNEIMDDDQDMEDMYLSRKLEAEAAAAGASPTADTAASLIRTASRASSVLTLPDGRLDISACENLLESYFMRADYLSSRLDGLRERLDDQEALVAIALDNRRNEIISLNLVATLLTAGLALVSAVAGLLGMNLAPLPVETTTVPFVAIVAASCVAGAAVFLGGMAFARRRALLWNPSEFPSVPRDG